MAACQSEFVGNLFFEAGAKHVICVDKKRSVLDDVAIDFTQNLYQRVLGGTQVCKAFQIAKRHSQIMFPNRELELFMLMCAEDCQCNGVRKPQDGKHVCQSDHIQVKEVQAKHEVQFREAIIADTIAKVRSAQTSPSHENNIVQLLGNPGVGKSAVMSHAIYFMMQRKYFTGGVLVLDLRDIKTFNEFRRKLELTLIKKLRLHSSSKRQSIEKANFQ